VFGIRARQPLLTGNDPGGDAILSESPPLPRRGFNPLATPGLPSSEKTMRIAELNRKRNSDKSQIYSWTYGDCATKAWTRSKARANIKRLLEVDRLPFGTSPILVDDSETN